MNSKMISPRIMSELFAQTGVMRWRIYENYIGIDLISYFDRKLQESKESYSCNHLLNSTDNVLRIECYQFYANSFRCTFFYNILTYAPTHERGTSKEDLDSWP